MVLTLRSQMIAQLPLRPACSLCFCTKCVINLPDDEWSCLSVYCVFEAPGRLHQRCRQRMLHTVARCNSDGNQINRFDRFDHLYSWIQVVPSLNTGLCARLFCIWIGRGWVGFGVQMDKQFYMGRSGRPWFCSSMVGQTSVMLLCSGLTTPNLAVRLCLRRALAPELSCGRPRGKHLHLLQIPLHSISFSHLGRCFVWTLKCIRLGIPVHIKKVIMISFHRIWESGTLNWVLKNRWRRGR